MANNRRRLVGVVKSNKMEKTVVVEVANVKNHPLYHKVIRVSKRYFAHDEQNVAQIGDVVQIVESRPLSKNKRWALEAILKTKTAPQVVEEPVA
jgi:small subunit ribosomal protein S17